MQIEQIVLEVLNQRRSMIRPGEDDLYQCQRKPKYASRNGRSKNLKAAAARGSVVPGKAGRAAISRETNQNVAVYERNSPTVPATKSVAKFFPDRSRI